AALMVTLAYSESRQKLGDLSRPLLARRALDIAIEFVAARLRTLALTIAAATSQSPRNIISARPPRLPRGAHRARPCALTGSRRVVDNDGVRSVAAGTIAGAVPVTRPLDPLTPVHRLQELPPGQPVGDADVVARWRLEGAVVAAAFLAGAAQACTDLSVAYAK